MDVESDTMFFQNNYNQGNQQGPRNYVKFTKFQKFNKAGEFVGERDHIIIISPGQPKSEVQRPVQEKDKLEYPQQWAAFLEGAEQRETGTPLEAMGLHPSMVRICNTLYIYTVEQLANVSDSALQNVGMGGHDARNKAKAFLEKSTAELAGFKRELDKANEENESLKQEVAALREAVEALQKPKKGGKPKADGRVAAETT